MVADRLANAPLYHSLSPKIAAALQYLTTTDFHSMPLGRHDLDGDAMYLILHEYQTRRYEECRWEAHRRYIDIQCMLKGIELMGIGNITRFAQEPYEAERDVIWMDGTGDLLTFREGTFMILWPEDAHMPGVMVDEPAHARKAVVKIAVP